MVEQIAWYAVSLLIYLYSLFNLRRGLVNSTAWFCGFFCLAFSGNIFAYPFALVGYEDFSYILGAQATTLHGQIMLVSMGSAWSVHLLSRRFFLRLRILRDLPILSLRESSVERFLVATSVAGSLMTITLSLNGYYGYFLHEEYMNNPPGWLDFTRKTIVLMTTSLLLLMISAIKKNKRLGVREYLLALLCLIAGVLSGFKLNVILPGLYAIIAAWIYGRLKISQLVSLVMLVIFAYSVIEPMRDVKQQGHSVTALQSLNVISDDSNSQLMDSQSVLERFVRRIDYSLVGIRSLAAYEHGLLPETKRRLDEYFSYFPLMTIIPRSLWPDKPLADIGRVLSTELFMNQYNSITPSQIVISYIWSGFFGVVITAAVWSFFLTLGGQLMLFCQFSHIRYAPFVIFAISLSSGSTIMASYFINLTRAFIVLGLVVFTLRVLRFLKSPVKQVEQLVDK